MAKINSNKKTDFFSFDIKNVAEILFITFLSFTIFILPIKLGSPYIDEIGFFIPTIADLIFGSWPALSLCYLGLFLISLFLLHSFTTKTIHNGKDVSYSPQNEKGNSFHKKFIKFLRRDKISITISINDIVLCLFLLVCVISISCSVNPHSSIINSYLFIASATGYFAAKKSLSLENKEKIIKIITVSILVSASFVSVNGIYQYLYGLKDMRDMIGMEQIKKMAMLYKESDPQNYSLYLRLMSNRIFSTFVYPNSLSGYLCMTFPFLIELFRLKKKDLLKTYSLIVIVSLGVIFVWFYLQSQVLFIPMAFLGVILFPVSIAVSFFLTGSKGGLITLIVLGFVYIFFFLIKKVKKKKTIFFILLSFLIISIAIILFSIPSQKLKSLYARTDYWRSCTEMIKDSPVVGYGLGTFGNVYPKYKLPSAEETQFAHNNYLQLATEIGIPGAISYLILLIYSLFIFYKSYYNGYPGYLKTASGLAITSFFVHGFVDFDLYIPAISFYVFFTIGIISSERGKIYKFPFNGLVLKSVLSIAGLILFINFYGIINNIFKAQYYFNIAKTMFYQKNESGKSINLLNRAITLDKKNGKLYFLKGNIYFYDNDFEKAIENYEIAVYYERHRASYRYQLAQSLIKSGNPKYRQRAEIELEKAKSLNPHKQQF